MFLPEDRAVPVVDLPKLAWVLEWEVESILAMCPTRAAAAVVLVSIGEPLLAPVKVTVAVVALVKVVREVEVRTRS